VFWLCGEPGSGKTYAAINQLAVGCTGVYIHSGTKWFNGYNGQEVVILDDLRKETFSWELLLKLLDRYPIDVETKGSMVPFVPKIIVITNPSRPSVEFSYYNKEKGESKPFDNIMQLTRRINFCYETYTTNGGAEAGFRLIESEMVGRHQIEKPKAVFSAEQIQQMQ